MERDPLSYMTLGVAWREIVYTASCQQCHELRRVDLRALAERFGEDFPLGDVRSRLRCSTCGGRDVIICTRWKNVSSSAATLQRFPLEYDWTAKTRTPPEGGARINQSGTRQFAARTTTSESKTASATQLCELPRHVFTSAAGRRS